MQLLETCIQTTGAGTPMIQSRAATGWEIKMLSTICAKKLLLPFSSSNLMAAPSPELQRAKSINEPSEDNPDNLARVHFNLCRTGL